jgi:F0F1-type ATP synthase membrane subunit b/b'
VLVVILSGEWLNYPGFEAWKFANLAIFIAVALYLHRRLNKPVSEALRARARQIEAELERSRQRKAEAVAELEEVEEKLSRVQSEVARIETDAQSEAAAERDRIQAAIEFEVEKLKAQGARQISKAEKSAELDLRRYAVGEGITRAEAMIRSELTPSKDTTLIGGIAEQLTGGRQA